MYWLIFFYFLTGFLPFLCRGFKCADPNSTNLKESDVLNIHLVPHSHLDPGWQTTFDGYYNGEQTTMAYACVKCIIDAVTSSLPKDSKRRFAFSEISFLKHWWDKQSKEKQSEVRQLVEDGRLYFINGGWVVNDEALTHYASILEQYSLGFEFLEKNFGKNARPHVAWQIDPFGHSSGFASLARQIGFDGMVLNRISFLEKKRRIHKSEMEFMWKIASSSKQDDYMFSVLLYDHYSVPSKYCFDERCAEMGGWEIEDLRSQESSYVDRAVQTFVDEICYQARAYKTNHIMVLMGDDFHYSNAETIFQNMEIMLKRSEKISNAKLRMSSPWEYLQAINQQNLTWPVKTGDFFPYFDSVKSVWTGYYSSRPFLKRILRYSEGLLQGCKQIHALVGSVDNDTYSPQKLRESVSLLQHHDAITGTAKNPVAEDYIDRLEDGANKCLRFMEGKILPDRNISFRHQSICSSINIGTYMCHGARIELPALVTIYNPLSWPVSKVIQLVTPQSASILIDPENGISWPYQQQSFDILAKKTSSIINAAMVLPGLGLKRFIIEKGNITTSINSTRSKLDCKILRDDDNYLDIGNGRLKLTFSKKTGLLLQVINLMENKSSDIKQQYFEITDDGGAYIFRPEGVEQDLAPDNVTLSVHLEGPLAIEIYQMFGNHIRQVTRLLQGTDFFEIDYEILPSVFDMEGIYGRGSVFIRFQTDFHNNSLLFTDCNGREEIARSTGNQSLEYAFFPVPTRLSLQDAEADKQLVLLPDRPLGGASSCSGCLELMLFRKSEVDDLKGLGEGLKEGHRGRSVIETRGKIRVLFGTSSVTKVRGRKLAEEILKEPIVFYHTAETLTKKPCTINNKFSFLGKNLPQSVQLLSVERKEDRILVRLEHIGDPAGNSKEAEVHLGNIFEGISISSAEERAITGDVNVNEIKPLDWTPRQDEKMEERKTNNNTKVKRRLSENDLNILIKPYQIRTFLLRVKRIATIL